MAVNTYKLWAFVFMWHMVTGFAINIYENSEDTAMSAITDETGQISGYRDGFATSTEFGRASSQNVEVEVSAGSKLGMTSKLLGIMYDGFKIYDPRNMSTNDTEGALLTGLWIFGVLLWFITIINTIFWLKNNATS